MTVRVFIPNDMAAVAVGADAVAEAIRAAAQAAGIPARIVRNGSRGLFRIEPLVEVQTADGRVGYGPVAASDVPSLVAAGLFEGRGGHPLHLGDVGAMAFFARQTRLTFARNGLTDPLSLDDYRANGGYAGLEKAVAMTGEAMVDAMKVSGLRGRGGAGFPTGIKWDTVRLAPSAQKYIVCNADEGDSGTFADRMVMEGDPFVLIEGMTIAGLCVGATKGYVYCRSEYPFAVTAMNKAVAIARAAGLLGGNVAGSGKAFDMEVRVGAGAYVCGEETALLDSLEGKRGQVRAKPPLPAHVGLFGQPTVINNVLSLAAVPFIFGESPEAYRDFGVGRSRGTMPIQLAGDILNGGLFETPFGITLGDLVDDIGGGTESGRPVRAVQVGGPLGAYFPRALFDTPFDYEAFTAAGGLIGHGGVVVFNDSVDMVAQARFAMNSAPSRAAASARPAGSARRAVSRLWTGSPPTRTGPPIWSFWKTCARL